MSWMLYFVYISWMYFVCRWYIISEPNCQWLAKYAR